MEETGKGKRSSNINEVIKTVLNFLFFYEKDFTRTKRIQGTKKHQKTVLNLLFIYFYDKILHAQKAQKNTRHQKVPKAQKAPKSTNSIKTQPSKSTKTQISR